MYSLRSQKPKFLGVLVPSPFIHQTTLNIIIILWPIKVLKKKCLNQILRKFGQKLRPLERNNKYSTFWKQVLGIRNGAPQVSGSYHYSNLNSLIFLWKFAYENFQFGKWYQSIKNRGLLGYVVMLKGRVRRQVLQSVKHRPSVFYSLVKIIKESFFWKQHCLIT